MNFQFLDHSDFPTTNPLLPLSLLHSLNKNYRERPYYTELLRHEFIENNKEHDISEFVKKTLEL